MKRLGIVGAGAIGAAHKNAIEENLTCKLAAICDLDPEKAALLAEGTEARMYTDYREMQSREELDAVILNLPHFLHREVSVYFLENRVAVLVEKPMANTVAECNAMIAAAEKTKTPLAVGHVQRYYECYRHLQALIRSGGLGKLCLVTEVRNTDYFTNRPAWFLNREQAGGGIVMNYGAHTLDKLFYTTGLAVEHVSAAGSNLLTDHTVEAAAQILLKLSGGVSAAFTYCGCRVPGQYETCFYFTDGAAKIENGEILWVSHGTQPLQRVALDYEKDIFSHQLAEFLKLLDGRENEAATPAYGKEIISVLEQVFSQIG